MRSGFCPRQQTPPPKPSRSMWQAIFTALPVVLSLILLPTIAFASPPDPSWVAGIYDGADGDDIVSLLYETAAANVAVPSHIGPLPCVAEISLEGIVRSVPGSRLTRGPRSPPILWSMDFANIFNSLPPPASGTEVPVTLPSITKLACPDLATSQHFGSQKLISSPAKLKRRVGCMQDTPASRSRYDPPNIHLLLMEQQA